MFHIKKKEYLHDQKRKLRKLTGRISIMNFQLPYGQRPFHSTFAKQLFSLLCWQSKMTFNKFILPAVGQK